MRKISSEQGVAMVTMAVLVVISLGIAGSLVSEVSSRHKEQAMQTDIKQAESIALSGLEKIRRFLYVYKRDATWVWSDILKYNQGMSTNPETIKKDAIALNVFTSYDTYSGYHYYSSYGSMYAPYGYNPDTLPEAPVPLDKTTPGTSPMVFGVPTAFSNGAFHIVVQNDTDDPDPLNDVNEKLDLIVTGVLSNGTVRQLKVRVKYLTGKYTPMTALTTGGSIKIGGVPEVRGALGGVHTNMNALITGNPIIDQRLTAVGSVSITGVPMVGGGIWPFSAPVSLPDVDPDKYKSTANYLLKADGTVVDNATGLPLASLAPSGTWGGFKFAGGDWSANGNDIVTSAIYYIETYFTLNGNAGADATFLVANSIKVTGTAAVSGLGNMTIIAKGDMELQGTATFKGFLACQEQIKLSGTPNIEGSVLARDKQDLFGHVSTQSEIYPDIVLGKPVITYNVPVTTLLDNPLGVTPESIWRIK